MTRVGEFGWRVGEFVSRVGEIGWRVGAKLSRVGPICPRADNWVERRLYFAEKKDRMAF